MAVDNIGTAVVENDLCLLAGRVRAIDGDTLVVVTADGKHAFRVKSTDTRKVDTVIDPVLLDDVTSGVDGKQPLSSNLTALAGLTGAANKLPAFSGLGTMTLVDLTTLVQAAAGAFTTTAPTSAVAAAGANDLVRKGEVDAVVVLLSGYILGKQDANANLSAVAGLTSAADKVPYFTGSGTAAVATLTAAARTFLAATDAAGQRSAMGLAALAILASVGTSQVDDDAITNAKLRNSGGLSVIGRTTNSSGDPADITAANDGEVLRRSGTSLAFGTVATSGIANDAVTFAKQQNLSAPGLVGRRSSSGDPEQIDGANIGAASLRGATKFVVFDPDASDGVRYVTMDDIQAYLGL